METLYFVDLEKSSKPVNEFLELTEGDGGSIPPWSTFPISYLYLDV
jgi:hypothetical protein